MISAWLIIRLLGVEQSPDLLGEVGIGGMADDAVIAARARDRHRELADDAAGPRRHHHDPVGEEDRLGDRVRDQHHRLAARLPDPLPSRFMRSRVSASSAPKGSSISSTRGLRHQRAADAGALLHAARELIGIAMAEILQPGDVEQPVDVLGLADLPAADAQRQRHVLAHRQPGQQVGRLEHDADIARGAGDRPAVERGLAAVMVVEPGQDAQQGRLAAARGTDDADELTVPDVEIDVGQRVDAAAGIGLAEAADADEDRAAPPRAAAWRRGLGLGRGRPCGSPLFVRLGCSPDPAGRDAHMLDGAAVIGEGDLQQPVGRCVIVG